MRELSAGQAMQERITTAMLEARAALSREFEQLHRNSLLSRGPVAGTMDPVKP